MTNLFDELKRRNVFRVAIIYFIVSWVAMQTLTIRNRQENQVGPWSAQYRYHHPLRSHLPPVPKLRPIHLDRANHIDL